MASHQSTAPLSVTAGAVVRIYRFVTLQADGKYDESGSAQGRADGVAAQAAAADGDIFAMKKLDGSILKLEAGAAVTRGDQIGTDNQGRAITHVSGAGNYILGEALEAASAAGEIIRVMVSKTQDGAT